MRLDGGTLEPAREEQLPSEGAWRGAVQVPPSGEPVLFLADHPVTGGVPGRRGRGRRRRRPRRSGAPGSARALSMDGDPMTTATRPLPSTSDPSPGGTGGEERAGLSPREARRRFRDGLVTPTAGWSAGWTQANLMVLPRDLALDFLVFAQRNPQPCPVLDVLEAGQVCGPLLDGDVRTDLPAYRVYVDGGAGRGDRRGHLVVARGPGLLPGRGAASPSRRPWARPGCRCATSSRVSTCRCTPPPAGAGPPEPCRGHWWSRCDRCPPTRSPTRSGSARATPRSTARPCTWGTPRPWASPTSAPPTSGTRCRSARGRYPSSGPAG